MVELEIDGQPVRVFEGETILGRLPPARDRHADALLRRHARARQRLPRLRRRGRGLARARAGLLAQGRGRDEGARPTPSACATRAGWCSSCSASSVDLSTTPSRAGYLERYDARARALRAAGAARSRPRPQAHRPSRRARRADRRHRARAGEDRQRALRARLLEVHPLLQVRRRLRRAVPEHLRDPRRRARLRRAHLDRVRHASCPSRPASTAATASRSARPAR